jgi:hypothetical protein
MKKVASSPFRLGMTPDRILRTDETYEGTYANAMPSVPMNAPIKPTTTEAVYLRGHRYNGSMRICSFNRTRKISDPNHFLDLLPLLNVSKLQKIIRPGTWIHNKPCRNALSSVHGSFV